MAPLPCAGGQLWSPLYRRACARGWCATMVSSRQGMSVSKEASKEAGSVSLHGCLDIGGSNDQLHLKIARLLRSPRAPLQRRLWPEGWWRLRIWEPTSRALPAPILWVLLLCSAMLSLLRSTPPLPCSDHAHAKWCGTVTRDPTLFIARKCPFTMCFHPPNPFAAACNSYHPSCLSVNTTQFPPNNSTKVIRQLGLTWWWY